MPRVLRRAFGEIGWEGLVGMVGRSSARVDMDSRDDANAAFAGGCFVLGAGSTRNKSIAAGSMYLCPTLSFKQEIEKINN